MPLTQKEFKGLCLILDAMETTDDKGVLWVWRDAVKSVIEANFVAQEDKPTREMSKKTQAITITHLRPSHRIKLTCSQCTHVYVMPHRGEPAAYINEWAVNHLGCVGVEYWERTFHTTIGNEQWPGQAVAPAAVLKHEMSERGWHCTDVSMRTGGTLSAEEVGILLTGELPIGPATAQSLATAFGSSSQYWLNLQHHYDESLAHAAEKS